MEKFLLTEKGKGSQRKASTQNCKFTMICLTSFHSKPVMCVLIIEGSLPNGPNGAIESGVDITKKTDDEATDEDIIIRDSGAEKYFPGGPECLCRGEKAPALVCWHESVSIIDDILVDMLKTMHRICKS